jgi:type II restriction/modification system DNA methylase subunit YeeA
VCYWFERSREELRSGRAERVGLVATQSIRKGASRTVLDRIREDAIIYDAWSDEEWTVDGADVRVSLICFARGHTGEVKLNGKSVLAIRADLSAGGVDLTKAHRLAGNLKVSFQGPVVIGRFDISGETARRWLAAPKNANGKSNAGVLRPYVNGQDLTKKRPPDIWLIDFAEMEEAEAAYYALPFAHTMREVKPQRDKNRRPRRRLKWWQHGETVPGWRAAVAPLKRFIVTPRVSRHRVFVWLDAIVMPDSRLYAIARDDDTSFGILHSRFHVEWAIAQGSRHGVGNDPTYNNQTCFETFPFPDGLTPDQPAISYADDPRANAVAETARALVSARNRWLHPDDLVDWVPEVARGFPARPVPKSSTAATQLKKRTLTILYATRGAPEGAWLDNLHNALDSAVASAYGWPATIEPTEALAKLLELNHARRSSDT